MTALILPGATVPGAAQETTSQAILAALNGFATEATLDAVLAAVTGAATETTLADVKTILDERLGGTLVPAKYDYVGYTDGGASETFVYKTGGASGTTQKTVVIAYSDSTKDTLVSVTAT